ncbi:hypothetical protein [Moheibacter sp.]|uniref:hypothetical protein n=1 Tax=Moheibacter sp. TaxID=1965316 RepID=UPI003C78FA46
MDNLSLEEYEKLSDHDKYDLVFKQGDFIDIHIKSDSRFVLYSLFTFFVEVEYKVSQNKISGIDYFIDGDKLERYTNY